MAKYSVIDGNLHILGAESGGVKRWDRVIGHTDVHRVACDLVDQVKRMEEALRIAIEQATASTLDRKLLDEARKVLGDAAVDPEIIVEDDLGPWVLDRCYMIRTVTMTWTGRLVAIHPMELLIDDAAWIADTGRYHEAVDEEHLAEVEPVDGCVVIGRGSIVDARVWRSALPRQVK